MATALIDRIMAHIQIDPVSGCWMWTRPPTRYGYGQICVMKNGKQTTVRVHRAVYEALVGPIPAGRQLDHTCHNEDPTCKGGTSCRHRACANPAHLQPSTNRENTIRGRAADATRRRMRGKAVCDQGHPLHGLNVYTTSRGHRICRACKREWARKAAKTGARGPRRRVVSVAGSVVRLECGHVKQLSPSRQFAHALCPACESIGAAPSDPATK